jgi:hypothetical protein
MASRPVSADLASAHRPDVGPKIPIPRASAVFTALLLAIAGLSALAGPAQAQPNPRLCTNVGTMSFTPGLRTAAGTTISISGTGTLSPCLDLGVATGVTGTYTLTGSGTASCATQNFTATQTISWNNGNNSVVSLTSVVGALGTFAFAGTVSSGELANNPVVFALTVNPSDLPNFLIRCVSPGGATSVGTVGEEVFLAQ